jgi:hypothetical protein
VHPAVVVVVTFVHHQVEQQVASFPVHQVDLDLASLYVFHDLGSLIVLSLQIASSYLSLASWFLCLLC